MGRKRKSRHKHYRFKGFRSLIRFLLLNVLIFMLTSPFVILYGPFQNVRNAVVGAVATSMHRYLLNYFLSPEEIDKILANSRNIVGDISEKLFYFNNSHSAKIKFTQIKSSRFKGYILEISDPTRLQVGVSNDLGQSGQTTSEIARQNKAIAAVNAGGFDDPNGTGTGRLPIGVIIHNGYYIVGENIKGKVDLVGLNQDGILVVGKYTVQQMKEMQIKEGITFGPPLIINGQKQITKGDGGWGIGPRTAIGQKKDGTILLLVIDGRQPHYSIGATLVDVQNILFENGAYIAANLDGGSSATMFYQDKVVNKPCDILGERSIPSAFIVK
ncbi:phosphodiester glycosidase family protein [Bacillota bacterium LX-D]|nr:phosphodiester glycosidase family protein [Bacillota bacterium LX-D]